MKSMITIDFSFRASFTRQFPGFLEHVCVEIDYGFSSLSLKIFRKLSIACFINSRWQCHQELNTFTFHSRISIWFTDDTPIRHSLFAFGVFYPVYLCIFLKSATVNWGTCCLYLIGTKEAIDPLLSCWPFLSGLTLFFSIIIQDHRHMLLVRRIQVYSYSTLFALVFVCGYFPRTVWGRLCN